MKKLIFFLLLLSAAAIATWLHYQPDAALSVEVISPQRGRIETVIRVTGDIVNDRTVKMAALVDGQIQKCQCVKATPLKPGKY